MSLGDAWEQHADEWITWARTSRHDGFESGTWPELRALLPPAEGLVVEIGCGEGRVARALMAIGHRVIGIELSPTLAHAAHHTDPPVTVVRADGAAVPLADGIARLVVACMSLQDIDDMSTTVAEAARILQTGGQLCAAIVHQFASSEDPATLDKEVRVVSEPYLRERRYEDRVERDGIAMTFVSQHRPLSAYLNAFADAGFNRRDCNDGIAPRGSAETRSVIVCFGVPSNARRALFR